MQQTRKNERKNRLQERNIKVRTLFNELVKKHPQWRLMQLLMRFLKGCFCRPVPLRLFYPMRVFIKIDKPLC